MGIYETYIPVNRAAELLGLVPDAIRLKGTANTVSDRHRLRREDRRNRRPVCLPSVGLGLLVLIAFCLLSGVRGLRDEEAAFAGPTGPSAKSDLVPKQTPAKAIRGKVIDDNGNPVVGAELWMPMFLPERRILATNSDEKGEFSLNVPLRWITRVPPQPPAVIIWAYAEGHRLGTGPEPFGMNVARDVPEVVIRLGSATDTEFVILDPEGRPRINATVEPYHVQGGIGTFAVPQELVPRIRAITDAEGRVKFPAIPRDRLNDVRITTDDLGVQEQPFSRNPLAASEQRTIRLRATGKIEGRVIADQPEMARGVRLIFKTDEFSFRKAPPTPEEAAASAPELLTKGVAEVVSDEQGRFAVPAIASGSLRIEGPVDDELPYGLKLPRAMGSVKVKAGETTTLEIPLAPTITARGSIVAADTGEPVRGATVAISSMEPGGKRVQAVSDIQGRFTVRVLPGRHMLFVGGKPGKYSQNYCQLGSPFDSAYEVPEHVKEFDWPPIELAPTKSITGRVIDQKDQPVVDGMISIVEGRAHYGVTSIDANGGFTMRKVPTMIDVGKATYEVSVPATKRVPNRPTMCVPVESEVIQVDPVVIRAQLDKQKLRLPPFPGNEGVSVKK